MSDRDRLARDRVDELLIQRATEGLSREEQHELEGLLSIVGEPDSRVFDAAAADAARVLVRVPARMPAHVRVRIAASAAPFFAQDRAVTHEVAVRPATPWMAWSGWLAAAALLLLLVLVWRPSAAPSLAEQRATLGRAPDVVRLQWKATDDPLGRSASGEVLWSAERQAGFMTFRGLAPNDATHVQYQLWIFDATRDERYPVDGGVFDVRPGSDEVIVPIRAAVHVTKPTLFAITAEAPGGVVVSSRERICVTAKAG